MNRPSSLRSGKSRRHSNRGVAALAVTLLLLFATSLALLYVNRAQIFDQRASANLTHSTTAIEAAEAGVEWATGMLNTPFDIGTDCAFQSSANISFRKRYVMTNWNAATNPTKLDSSAIRHQTRRGAIAFVAIGPMLACSIFARHEAAVRVLPLVAGTRCTRTPAVWLASLTDRYGKEIEPA